MGRRPSNPPQRRQFPRAVLEVPVTAVRQGTAVGDYRHVVSLHVLNVSRGGLGAVASEPLEEREPLVIFFPPIGARKGRDTAGRVVRCVEQEADKFAVGIAFDKPWPEREFVGED